MLNNYFLILKIKKAKVLCLAAIVFAVSAFSFNFSSSAVYADITARELPVAASQLLNKPIFRENEQSAVLVHPRFNDNSTNIAFYAECPTIACPDDGAPESPEFIFFAENPGHGYLSLSDYWAPDPSFRKLVAIEYFNDGRQFTCSDLSLNDCLADPHFISRFNFEIVDNNAVIPASVPPTIDFIESGAVTDTLYIGDQASSTALTDNAATAAPTSGPAPVIQVNEDRSITIDIIETGQVIENNAEPTPVIQVNEDGSVTVDIIEIGAVSDNYAASAAPIPELTPAPVIQVNEDGSVTVDVVETGQAIENNAGPAPAVSAPVIQENGDGSTTLIAI